MEHDEFIGRVQQQGHLMTIDDAEWACQATLGALGEQVSEGLVDNIAVQLPPRIADHLRRTEDHERAGRENFISRVAERAGIGDDQAAYIARAVLDTLYAATEGGLMAKITESLPAEMREYVGPVPNLDSWAYGNKDVPWHRTAGGGRAPYV
ncbi:MAG TPA: DUF2267 domain-containing protein [Trebonia sp.]|nr:DUF2267 domain-containing protein [Trebonia sp.]